MKIPIHEYFHTFQGEGVHIGRPAFFIRTFGCPVHCPWCDSAGTWHKDFTPDHVEKYTPEELFERCHSNPKVNNTPMVVVTGGEPCVYDLTPLTDLFRKRSYAMHLETSGSFPIRGYFDWITLSPKKWKLPLEETVQAASEFKIIVEKPSDIGYYWEVLRERGLNPKYQFVWLHPEWSRRNDKQVLRAISETVMACGGEVRAGWQIHKLYQVDALDPNSKPQVPLGGDIKKGY